MRIAAFPGPGPIRLAGFVVVLALLLLSGLQSSHMGH